MKIIVSFILLVCLVGCERGGIRQAQDSLEKNAIKSVQQADSSMPGVSCVDFIGRMAKIAESQNMRVKSKGWIAYQEQSHIVVVYAMDRNNEPLEWKWYIENDEIIPVNGFSRGISVRQKVKL